MKENTNDADIYKPILSLIPLQSFVFFDSNDNISDNVSIKLTHGHTVGHSSLEFSNSGKKILVAGDAVKSSIDLLNNNSFGNAQIPEACIRTKCMIREVYNIVIPGHSDLIDLEKIVCAPCELRPF